MIMLGLLAMFSFFDLINELDSLGRGNYGINNMLVFVLLSVPGHIYEVVPVAVLLGMMYSLGTLGGNSELIVMREWVIFSANRICATENWPAVYRGDIFSG